jgi:hypothetical protein
VQVDGVSRGFDELCGATFPARRHSGVPGLEVVSQSAGIGGSILETNDGLVQDRNERRPIQRPESFDHTRVPLPKFSDLRIVVRIGQITTAQPGGRRNPSDAERETEGIHEDVHSGGELAQSPLDLERQIRGWRRLTRRRVPDRDQTQSVHSGIARERSDTRVLVPASHPAK